MVLVVDDNPESRGSFQEKLANSGLLCESAAGVFDACQILSSGGIDLVVSSMDWHEDQLVALAREASKSRSTLLCSGEFESRQNLAAAMRLGARGFICKPWPDADALQAKLRATLLDSAELMLSGSQLDSSPSELEARYETLKSDFAEQRSAFEESQEIFYLDLSRMMTIIGNIMDGIVFADSGGHITLMNPVAEDFLGTKSFMAIGRTISQLSGCADLVNAIQEDYSRVDGQKGVLRTVEVHEESRELMYIKMHTTKVLDYCGNAAGTLVVMQDITSEYKSEQLKNQYLSIVAHELRTPLTGIKTFSTMMAKGSLGELSEKQQRVMESIREQSLRLEHQIDKLINLGHIESNEYGQDLEVFDLNELVQQAAAPFELPADDRSIKLNVHLSSSPMLVRGDRADLRRAAQALIENALKFTGDDGVVDVDVGSVGDQVELVVRDSGIGIDPRYHQRILEKFFQVEDPLTRHHGGAGLGLFFVRGITDAHGSEIKVESDLGHGAKFSFKLPLCNDNVARSTTGCVDESSLNPA